MQTKVSLIRNPVLLFSYLILCTCITACDRNPSGEEATRTGPEPSVTQEQEPLESDSETPDYAVLAEWTGPYGGVPALDLMERDAL
jgi:hypothetical protein